MAVGGLRSRRGTTARGLGNKIKHHATIRGDRYRQRELERDRDKGWQIRRAFDGTTGEYLREGMMRVARALAGRVGWQVVQRLHQEVSDSSINIDQAKTEQSGGMIRKQWSNRGRSCGSRKSGRTLAVWMGVSRPAGCVSVRMRVRRALSRVFKPKMKVRVRAHRTRKHEGEHQITRQRLLPPFHASLRQ